jgi:hypothetical protein
MRRRWHVFLHRHRHVAPSERFRHLWRTVGAVRVRLGKQREHPAHDALLAGRFWGGL